MDEEKGLMLSERFCLKRDKYQVWIEELVKSKNGEKERWNRITGYCSTFDELMKNFAERRFRTVDANSIKELLKQMTKIEAETKALCKKILKEGGSIE